MIEELGRATAVLVNTIALIERLQPTPVHLISTPIFFKPDYAELVDPVGILKAIQQIGVFKVDTKSV